MRYYLVIFLLLQTIISKSQETEFSARGKVSKLVVKKNKIVKPNSSGLIKLADGERRRFREDIAKKIEETLKRLNDSNDGLKSFCVSLWGQAATDNLIAELESAKAALNKNSFPSDALTVLRVFESSLTKHLVKDEGKFNVVYEYNSENDQTGQLMYVDPFNSFVIDYYNALISLPVNYQVKAMTLQQWNENIQFMSEQKKKGDSLIKVVYANEGAMTVSHFQAIRAFHKYLENPAKPYKKIQHSVSDWFKHWIWIRGGEVRLNPLDFTTDNFLEKFPELDLTKANIYNSYIDTVINRFIRYDSSARFEQFKKLLGEKQNGSAHYRLQARAEQMERNKKAIKDQLTVSRILNGLEIPEMQEKDFGLIKRGRIELTTDEPRFLRRAFKKASEENKISVRNKQYFYSYSFSVNDKFDVLQRKSFLTDPVRAGEVKKIVVHNTPAGHNAVLKTTSASIIDRSAFQQGTDTVLDLAGKMMKAAVSFSPFSLFSGFIKPMAGVIQADGTEFAAYGFSDPIKQSLSKKYNKNSVFRELANIYDREVFEIVLADEKFKRLFTEALSDKEEGELGKLLLEEYRKELIQQQQIYFDHIRKDSLSLAYMISAFNNSSLPPKELKGGKDDTPVYSSKLLTSDPSDDPIKYTMQIVGMKGTDSIQTISKFSFKVGKNYRFQFSAGIAYTFGNFIQSSAKEEGGAIKITNSAQSYRLLTGFHVHFGKGLFLQDNRLFGRFSERASFYLGVGIPKPLENVYVGLGYDLLPGLKITAGAHIYRNDRYVIQNNSIIEQRLQYNFAGPFAAIQIDPAGLLQALNIINSK